MPLDSLIDRFEELRGGLLARLRDLVGEAELDLVGRHPEPGEVTMRQPLATPDTAYLGILTRRDAPVSP